MKPLSLFSVLIVLYSSNLHGQSLVALTPAESAFTEYSASNFIHHRKHPKPGALTIVGGSTIGLGTMVALSGAVLVAFDYDFGAEQVNIPMRNKGRALEISGGVLVLGGLGMTIAGVIHDQAGDRQKWGIVSPENNELGIAYNF